MQSLIDESCLLTTTTPLQYGDLDRRISPCRFRSRRCSSRGFLMYIGTRLCLPLVTGFRSNKSRLTQKPFSTPTPSSLFSNASRCRLTSCLIAAPCALPTWDPRSTSQSVRGGWAAATRFWPDTVPFVDTTLEKMPRSRRGILADIENGYSQFHVSLGGNSIRN